MLHEISLRCFMVYYICFVMRYVDSFAGRKSVLLEGCAGIKTKATARDSDRCVSPNSKCSMVLIIRVITECFPATTKCRSSKVTHIEARPGLTRFHGNPVSFGIDMAAAKQRQQRLEFGEHYVPRIMSMSCRRPISCGSRTCVRPCSVCIVQLHPF